MLFRRIIINALFIGFLSGLLFTVVQYVGVSPIIFAAEEYEVAEPVVEKTVVEESIEKQQATVQDHHGGQAVSDHHHAEPVVTDSIVTDSIVAVPDVVAQEAGHHHDEEAWGPEDGLERTLYTLLANVLAGIGFAAILLAVMSQLQLQGLTKLSVVKGLAWGAAGFIAFFAAPGIGLPPEIPGIEAAPLDNRQSWWLLTVVASGIGIGTLAFAKSYFKSVGLALLALPYLIGAPHPAGPEFMHPDANAVAILTDLHHQFIIASGVTNLIFWLALGSLCAWAVNRYVLDKPVLDKQTLDSQYAQA